MTQDCSLHIDRTIKSKYERNANESNALEPTHASTRNWGTFRNISNPISGPPCVKSNTWRGFKKYWNRWSSFCPCEWVKQSGKHWALSLRIDESHTHALKTIDKKKEILRFRNKNAVTEAEIVNRIKTMGIAYAYVQCTALWNALASDSIKWTKPLCRTLFRKRILCANTYLIAATLWVYEY